MLIRKLGMGERCAIGDLMKLKISLINGLKKMKFLSKNLVVYSTLKSECQSGNVKNYSFYINKIRIVSISSYHTSYINIIDFPSDLNSAWFFDRNFIFFNPVLNHIFNFIRSKIKHWGPVYILFIKIGTSIQQ